MGGKFLDAHIVTLSWSGNKLVDNILRLQEHLGLAKTRRGVSINCIIAAALLLISQFGSITTIQAGQKITMHFPDDWKNSITIWAAISLITLAIIQFENSFLTPEVKTANCHYCSTPMQTSELICQNCKSKSRKGND